MLAVVDELPTATVCEPPVGKMYVKVTVALPRAVRFTVWTATGVLSTYKVTGKEPAMLNVFVTVAVIVDAVPATFASTVGVPYVTTGGEATYPYQPRDAPPQEVVATTSPSVAPSVAAVTLN